MKIRPVGAELIRTDRWTDMMKLTVVIRNFANAPKFGTAAAAVAVVVVVVVVAVALAVYVTVKF
jgi:hypothetical protein